MSGDRGERDERAAGDRRGPDGQQGNRPGGPPERGRSAAERTTLAISLAILALLVGLVGYQYVDGGADSPIVEVRPQLQAVRREGEAYYLPIEIANRGNRTAEDVLVRVSLASGEGRRESGEFQVPFLAGGATREGIIIFRADPARGELTVDTVSFVEP